MVYPYTRRPISSDTKDDCALSQGEWNWTRIYVTATITALIVAFALSY